MADSQDFDLVTVTGKEIQIARASARDGDDRSVTVPVTVKTIAGQSGSVDATYAGIPTVDGATATAGPTAGEPAGPDTGGTPIEIDGTGFADQVARDRVRRRARPVLDRHAVPLHGEQRHRSHLVDGAAEPGGSSTSQVCTVTACSCSDRSHDLRGRVPPLPAGRSEDRLDHARPRGRPRAARASRSPARTSAA